MPDASLADELLLANLPDEVKKAIARVYGAPSESGAVFTVEELAEAYDAGWEEAVDEMTTAMPLPRGFDYARDVLRGKGVKTLAVESAPLVL